MKAILSGSLFFLHSQLPGHGVCKVDIGEPATATCLQHKQPCLVLTSSSNIDPGFSFVANGIHYLAVVKRDKFSFISTDDQKFKTPEGFTIANCFADLNVARKDVWSGTGWGKFYELPSGWVCAFDFQGDLQNNSRILFFFKKDGLRSHAHQR